MLVLLLLPLLLDLDVNVVDVVVAVDGVAEAVDKCGQQLKLFVIVVLFVVDV